MLFGRASKSFVFGLLTAVAVSTAVAPAQAAPTVSVKTGSLGSVYFASGSAKLNSAARITLWRWLPQVNAASTLNVVGYVQKSGSASNDRALSGGRVPRWSSHFSRTVAFRPVSPQKLEACRHLVVQQHLLDVLKL